MSSSSEENENENSENSQSSDDNDEELNEPPRKKQKLNPKMEKEEVEDELTSANDEIDDDMYSVEKIEYMKMHEGKFKFNVKWADYDQDQNTFEPFELNNIFFFFFLNCLFIINVVTMGVGVSYPTNSF